MTEYAGKGPQACWDAINASNVNSAQLSGIVGDSAHTYGYHRGRNYISSSDYSCQQADDKAGPGEAASALDVTMNDADMKAVSKRLNDAVNKGDSRLHCLREWYGTTNGYDVTGRDVRTKNYITSDDSHLWHVHLSFYRKWADDPTECKKVAAVFTGSGSSSGGDTDMPKQIYLYSKSGQTTKMGKSGTWVCVGWDAALANTGGSSLSLPKGASFFSMSAWLYLGNLPNDYNMYWRIQTLDGGNDNKELAKFPIGEIRGTTGDTDTQFSAVGSVSSKTQTNLRILVASTMNDTVVKQAWWRCLYW